MKFEDLDSVTQAALTQGYIAGLRMAVFLDDKEVIAMTHTEKTPLFVAVVQATLLSPRYTMHTIADIEGFNDRDRCGTCKFYVDGHCHRDPPGAYPHNIYEPGERTVFIPFPPTLAFQWCGEYER